MTTGQWKCRSPASSNASAQVGVTESCLGDHTSLFMTGIFHPTEYIRILHLRAYAVVAPLPLPYMVFLCGFSKRPSFLTLLFQHWPGGCTVSNVPSDYWWGTFYKNASFLHDCNHDEGSFSALCNVSNPWQQDLLEEFWCTRKPSWSAIYLYHWQWITVREFFSSQVCSGCLSRCILALIICAFLVI